MMLSSFIEEMCKAHRWLAQLGEAVGYAQAYLVVVEALSNAPWPFVEGLRYVARSGYRLILRYARAPAAFSEQGIADCHLSHGLFGGGELQCLACLHWRPPHHAHG